MLETSHTHPNQVSDVLDIPCNTLGGQRSEALTALQNPWDEAVAPQRAGELPGPTSPPAHTQIGSQPLLGLPPTPRHLLAPSCAPLTLPKLLFPHSQEDLLQNPVLPGGRAAPADPGLEQGVTSTPGC